MNFIKLKTIYAFVVLLTISAALYGQEEGVQEVVAFNTETVVFHEAIPSLLNASNEELLAEPSMKQATADFAWEVGGPITRDILNRFKQILTEEEYANMRIDTKVQRFNPNEYSNTPGWHCDFFSTSDEQQERLVRLNPGLETATRIFLLVSGEPATEFMVPRDFRLDINVPTWSDLSTQVDSMVDPEDLYRIPIAVPVELSGNELHRVTAYQGEKPTVRYFMRVYLFPKGHSQYGVYRNELFDWETHPLPQPEEIVTVLGDINGFLDEAFAGLKALEVDVKEYEMTHLCYRTATEEDFLSKKEELSTVGTLISEVLAEGRPYLVFKLNSPIIYRNYEVSLIALPYPKPNNTYSTALQHVAFLMREDLTTLLDKYPQIEFDTEELDRAAHREIKLRFEGLVVKFHNVSLEELN